MILFIFELFDNVKHFSFYIEPSSVRLKVWCYIFWIIFIFNFIFFNETEKWESFQQFSGVLFQNCVM